MKITVDYSKTMIELINMRYAGRCGSWMDPDALSPTEGVVELEYEIIDLTPDTDWKDLLASKGCRPATRTETATIAQSMRDVCGDPLENNIIGDRTVYVLAESQPYGKRGEPRHPIFSGSAYEYADHMYALMSEKSCTIGIKI